MAVAVAVSGGGAVAVAVAVAVAGLTKRFFNYIQKDFLINVWVKVHLERKIVWISILRSVGLSSLQNWSKKVKRVHRAQKCCRKQNFPAEN